MEFLSEKEKIRGHTALQFITNACYEIILIIYRRIIPTANRFCQSPDTIYLPLLKRCSRQNLQENLIHKLFRKLFSFKHREEMNISSVITLFTPSPFIINSYK